MSDPRLSPKLQMTVRFQKNSGMVLLITLAFIVMITIFIVGFVGSMRVDRLAANFNFEKTRATLFAQAGIDSAVAILRQNTSDPNRNWISQPGQLIVGAGKDQAATTIDDRKVLQLVVPLSSGKYSGGVTDETLKPVDLNSPTFLDSSAHLITDRKDAGGSAIKMQTKWIYIRESGATDTSEQPNLFDKADPIVGRYAYWTDDESSKINYNLAWGRFSENTNPMGHPTKIDLSILTGFNPSLANAIHHYITSTIDYTTLNRGFFNTPEDARKVDAVQSGVSAALKANKFEVTHYNSDPDTTFFNEPRIVLTTFPKRAGWKYNAVTAKWEGGKPYLRILANEGTASTDPTDPGRVTAVDETKLNETMNLLMNYLKRTDWPMVSGNGSIQEKYYGAYPLAARSERLAQLAINVIDYVRSKESKFPVVEPLRISHDSPSAPFTISATVSSQYAYMGNTRGPKITEMGFWLSDDKKTIIYKAEIHWPKNYGLVGEVDLASFYFNAASNPFPIRGDVRLQPADVSPRMIRPGDYAVITRTYTASSAVGGRAEKSTLRIAIGLSTLGKRVDVCPLVDDRTAESEVYPVNPIGTSIDNIVTMEVNDPLVNRGLRDWVVRSSGHSLGQPNSICAVGQLPDAAITPRQDVDANGKISDSSLYMPPEAGQVFVRPDGTKDDNTLGMVLSTAELGYIHTGVESSLNVGTPPVTIPKGVPWRTLHLQPNDQATTVVPDWAFIDLFTTPLDVNDNAKYIFTPHNTSVGGRLNLNSKAEPFGISRTLPLAALLVGCPKSSANRTATVSASEAATLAGNIYERTLAAGSAPGKTYGYDAGFDSAGEVVEIKGIADDGEESEELVRQISGLITARGNVFSIYSVGQSLKQTPEGKIIVKGEERLHAIIERYRDSTSNQVQFSTIYFRNLTP